MKDPNLDPVYRTDGRYADEPYSDRRAEGVGMGGVLAALALIALLIGGLFWYSGGSGPSVATNPGATIDSNTGVSPSAPAPAQRTPVPPPGNTGTR